MRQTTCDKTSIQDENLQRWEWRYWRLGKTSSANKVSSYGGITVVNSENQAGYFHTLLRWSKENLQFQITRVAETLPAAIHSYCYSLIITAQNNYWVSLFNETPIGHWMWDHWTGFEIGPKEGVVANTNFDYLTNLIVTFFSVKQHYLWT